MMFLASTLFIISILVDVIEVIENKSSSVCFSLDTSMYQDQLDLIVRLFGLTGEDSEDDKKVAHEVCRDCDSIDESRC